MPPPTAPPANGGAAVGRALDNAGRSLGKTRAARRGRSLAGRGGSILVGLVAYSICINYLRYGPSGVKAYAEAKLMNRVTQPGPGGVPNPADAVGPADYAFRKARNAFSTGPAAPGPSIDSPPPSSAGRNFA